MLWPNIKNRNGLFSLIRCDHGGNLYKTSPLPIKELERRYTFIDQDFNYSPVARAFTLKPGEYTIERKVG